MTRLEARHAILAAANKHTQAPGFTYRMKNIQGAVCMVRRKRLVAGEILVLAGYNEVER